MKRRYLKKVASAVDAPGDEKREYLRIVEEDVDDFLADVPDATPEELEDTLGTPEELSDAYLEATPVEQVSKKLKKARSVKGIIIAAVCSAIALFAIIIFLAFVIARTNLSHLKTGDDSAGMHPRASNGYVDTKAFPPPFTYMAAQSGGKDEGAEMFCREGGCLSENVCSRCATERFFTISS